MGLPAGSDGQGSACSAGDPLQSPGQKDPLEEEMATHSSILAWRIPWSERGAWQAAVYVVAKSQTQLSD